MSPENTQPASAEPAVTRSIPRHLTLMASDPVSAPDKPRSDLQLLEALRRGDADALGGLYDRHAATLLGTALRILRNTRDAEDLVHDVFLEAWKRADGYDATRGAVRSWLLVRTRSRAIDRHRALVTARAHADAERQHPTGLAAVDDDPSRAADHLRAVRAMEQLTPLQRQVVELAYFGGLSCSDLASRCNIPIGTVKSRLSAALGKLRVELGEAR